MLANVCLFVWFSLFFAKISGKESDEFYETFVAF